MLSRFALRPVTVSRGGIQSLCAPNRARPFPLTQQALPVLSVMQRNDNAESKRFYVSKAAVEARMLPNTQGIMKAYGLYPLIGLAGAALIGKEIVIINEELMAGLDFMMVSSIVYLFVGDPLLGTIKKAVATEKKGWRDMFDLRYTNLDLQVKRYEALTKQPEVLVEFKEEYAQALADLIVAQRLMAQDKLRQSVEAALKAVYEREQVATANVGKAIKTKIISYVRNYLNTTAGQVAAWNEAMELAGTPTELKEGNMKIIQQAIDTYISSGQFDKDAEAAMKEVA